MARAWNWKDSLYTTIDCVLCSINRRQGVSAPRKSPSVNLLLSYDKLKNKSLTSASHSQSLQRPPYRKLFRHSILLLESVLGALFQGMSVK